MAYNASAVADWDKTKPVGSSETPGVLDDALREIKECVENDLGSSSSAKTGDYTLLAADLIGLSTFTNNGAGAQINFTWPALVAGQRAKFIVVDAQYLKITAPAGKKFRFLTVQGAAAGYIRSNTVGNVIECEATADDIVITSIGGAWLYDE